MPPSAWSSYPDTLEPRPPKECEDYLFGGRFADRGLGRYLVCSSKTYFFKRPIAAVFRPSQPNNHTARFAIYFGHVPNLLSLLPVVSLVDADSIYPYDPFDESIPKT